MRTTHSIRLFLCAFLGVLFFAQLISLAACAATTSEKPLQAPEARFIQSLGKKSNDILVDTSLSPAELDAQYKKMMDDSFDIDAINEFVLGRTWRQATPEQQREYAQLFKELVFNAYGGHLRFHKDEIFRVISYRPQSNVDTVVSTEIANANGTPPTLVDWVVRRREGGKLVIVDVIINGVSQNSAQHDEFATILAHNGGDFHALLDALRRKVQNGSTNR